MDTFQIKIIDENGQEMAVVGRYCVHLDHGRSYSLKLVNNGISACYAYVKLNDEKVGIWKMSSSGSILIQDLIDVICELKVEFIPELTLKAPLNSPFPMTCTDYDNITTIILRIVFKGSEESGWPERMLQFFMRF